INSKLPKQNNYITSKHASTLSHEELVENSAKLMTDNALLSLILPYLESQNFIEIAERYNLFPQRITNVVTKNNKKERILLEFSKIKNIEYSTDSLVIYNSNGSYSKEYKNKVAEYYLRKNLFE
ncbi:MAG: hypothetical protein R2771_15055, partial [Saprospiraceae bacterium]